MPDFNRSMLKVLGRDGSARPWRWTTEPVYGNGPMNPPTVAGVKEIMQGVMILASDEILAFIRNGLTAPQQTAVEGWKRRVKANPTVAEKADGWLDAVEWHIPLWAGQDDALYILIPQAVWNTPVAVPPALVKSRFKNLWSEPAA